MSLFKRKFQKSRLHFLLATFSSLLLLCIYLVSEHKEKGKSNSSLKSSDRSLSSLDYVLDSTHPFCIPYDELKENTVNFKIDIPKSRQWNKNIINAYMTSSKNIPAINRKRFKANVFLDDAKCSLNASVRISGDWKDHLAMHYGTPISSMDVRLQNGNIDGITKFKLFLPDTRNGINEVVTANLFSYLGLLAPRTSLVQVNVNGLTLPYILQEKAFKEFLEVNNRRESSIHKFDESLMWLLRAKNPRGAFAHVISPSVINNKWAARNATTSSITNIGLNKLSIAFNESMKDIIDEDNLMSESQLAGHSKKSRQIQSLFIVLSLITDSGHGVFINHNRRFYYNPFLDQLEPIYYDGNSNYNSLNSLPLRKKAIKYGERELIEYQDFLDIDHAKSKLDEFNVNDFQLLLNQKGVSLDHQTITNLKNELVNNLHLLETQLERIKKQQSSSK